MSPTSPLETTFATALVTVGRDLPPAEREYRFVPEDTVAYRTPGGRVRRWAFDFAWPAFRVAVEIDGGLQCAGGGRHGGRGDALKLRAAAALGWRVLHFSSIELRDSAGCVGLVREVILARSQELGICP